MWKYAMNGNVFMRSFARVEQTPRLAQRDLRGIQIADLTPDNAPGAAETDPILAHAETYFDCEGDWDACSGSAMWQLRWRARLRRVQPMQALAATAVQPALVSWLGTVIKKIESPLKKVKDTEQYKAAKKDVLNTIYQTSTFRHAGSWLLDSPSTNPIVH
jgi:hypothetical protein